MGKSTPDLSSTQGLLVSPASRKTSQHLSGDQVLIWEVREARTRPVLFHPRVLALPVLTRYCCGQQTGDAAQAHRAPFQTLGVVTGPLGGLCLCPGVQQSCLTLWHP